MQLSATATGELVAAIGVLHRVGRNGRWPELRHQIAVLRRLRCGQFQTLVLALEILQLALGQEIEDCTAVAVGIVDDVPRCGLDGVAGVAALRSHVIPELCRVGPLVAAALSGLHLHGSQLLHESRLLSCTGKLSLPKAVCHCHVGAVDKLRLLVKSVAKTLIYTVDLALDIGKIRSQHIAVDHAAAIAAVFLLACMLLHLFPVYRLLEIGPMAVGDYYSSDEISMAISIGSIADRREAQAVLRLADLAFSDVRHSRAENEKNYGLLARYAASSDSYPDAAFNEHTLELWSAHLEGNEGWIWVCYSSKTYNQDGSTARADGRAQALWKVARNAEGQWVVIQIREHP